MARDPLNTLLTIRQRTVDQSRQALAGCLAVETATADAIRAIDAAVEEQRAIADRLPEQHRGTDMVLAWSGRMRTKRAAAVAAFRKAELETASARAVLAESRAATQAVQRTIAERAIAAQAEAERRGQHALDDITSARHGARGREGGAGDEPT